MEVIYDHRQTGKTTQAITWAHDRNLVVVGANYRICENIKRLALELEKPITVMTWAQFIDQKYWKQQIDADGFVIDELGLCLQEQSRLPVDLITISREV